MEETYQKIRQDGAFEAGADKTETEFRSIGQRGVRRHDGYEKASGKALYTRDIQIPGMLFARVMRSPYPHARILTMDTRRAEALPGVRGVLRYDDPLIQGRTLNGSVLGTREMLGTERLDGWGSKPVNVILAEEAYFEGQAVGAVVVADTEDIAIEGLSRIAVEWEQLPFVLDQEEALEPDAPILRPGKENNRLTRPGRPLVHGDVEKGFEEADTIIEFRARRDAHLWAGAEMPSAVVRWSGENLELWLHVQHPYLAKRFLGEQLDIPMNRISIHSPYQGCSFGERCNPSDFSANGMNVLAVLSAKMTGSPVKLLFDRAEKFYGESGDMMASAFKVGAKADGTITAVHASSIFAVNMATSGIDHFVENTRISNLRFENVTADVSKAPAWWCRCEQLPNTFCLTLVFDHVAAALGLDPTLVALKNDGCDGKDMCYLADYKEKNGFPQVDSLAKCLEVGKKASQWDEKWHLPGAKKLPNGKMHGIAFTWTHEWDDVRGAGSAAVQVEADGTVSIVSNHADIGVNPWTAYKQIVADELGVRYEDVNVKAFDTDQGYALMTPDGSCNLITNGYIVRKAARKAKKILLDLAAEQFEIFDIDLLEVKGGKIYEKSNRENVKTVREVARLAMAGYNAVSIATGPPIMGWAWHNQGNFGQAIETGRPRLCRQAHFMEVEVDPETGQVDVTRVVNVNDVGKAVSPETVEGQMYGGTYMGVGRGTMEEMIWDPPTGVLLNRDLLNYKYATMLDVGPVDTRIVESGMGHGPYGTVGIGEDVATVIPALVGPAVYNAIGKWIDDFPIAPDRVLKALGRIPTSTA
jgi:xanthine dehydrogenase molybdenum-binding subunit